MLTFFVESYWEIDTYGDDTGDSPLLYVPRAAILKHKSWQTYVEREVRHKLPVKKWVPEIGKILSILWWRFYGCLL